MSIDPEDPEDPEYTVERVLAQAHAREALSCIRGKVPTHELAAFAEGHLLIEAFERIGRSSRRAV